MRDLANRALDTATQLGAGYADVRLVRRLGESIGLASKMSPLRIQWNQVNGSTIAFRAVVLDLSLVPAGKYQLKIETSSAQTTRLIELR